MQKKKVKGTFIYLWSISHSIAARVISVQIGPAEVIDGRACPVGLELKQISIAGPEYDELESMTGDFTHKEVLAFAIVTPDKIQKRNTKLAADRKAKEAAAMASGKKIQKQRKLDQLEARKAKKKERSEARAERRAEAKARDMVNEKIKQIRMPRDTNMPKAKN